MNQRFLFCLSMIPSMMYADIPSDNTLADAAKGAVSHFETNGMISEAYEEQPASNMQNSDQENISPLFTMSAGPRISHHGVNVNVRAEFIYWTSQDTFQPYYSGTATMPDQSITTPGKPKFLHNTFEPGFRVGLGLDFAHDNWDMELLYTWLYSAASQSTDNLPPNDQGFSADQYFNDPGVGAFVVENIAYKSKRTLNTWDLNLGRNFYLSPYLTVRPCTGFVAFYIPGTITETIGYIRDPGAALSTSRTTLKSNGLGFGTKMGCTANWYFARQWSVKANYFIALAWSQNRAKGIDTITTPVATSNSVNTKMNLSTCTLWQQMFLGLSWDMLLRNDKSQLQFYAGWEFNHGLPQVYFFRGSFTAGANLESLYDSRLNLQGLTIGGKYDF